MKNEKKLFFLDFSAFEIIKKMENFIIMIKTLFFGI